MGEYMSKLNNIKEEIYHSQLDKAASDLRLLLNQVYQDYKTTAVIREKLIMEKTMKVLIPVKDDLASGLVTARVISVLQLDPTRLQESKNNDAPIPPEEPKVPQVPSPEPEQSNEQPLPPNSFFDSVPKPEDGNPSAEEPSNPDQQPNDEFGDTPLPPSKPSDKLVPMTLDDYIGQEKAKEILRYQIQAAKIKNACLNHIMICSPYGLGKTTLANIIANEMGTRFINVNAVSLSDAKSLHSFFIKEVNEPCIIFIDEIHTLSKPIQTLLLTIITDFKVEYIDKEGNTAKKNLPRFTLIGATTQAGELLKPFINRFQILELVDYTQMEQITIVRSKFEKLGYAIDDTAVVEVAKRCRGVPRTMEIYARGITDIALTRSTNRITTDICEDYFRLNEIDEKGLTVADIKILRALVESDRPLGLVTLESKTGIQREDLEFRYEPYMIKLGFIEKTEKGRIATLAGRKYLEAKDAAGGH